MLRTERALHVSFVCLSGSKSLLARRAERGQATDVAKSGEDSDEAKGLKNV